MLRTVILIALVAAACGDDGSGGDIDASSSLDANENPDATDDPIDAAPAIDPLDGRGDAALVDDGFQFLEGPRWSSATGTLLFSDIPANIIYELTPPDTVAPRRDPSGNANGLAFDPDGNLLACEHGGRRVSRTDSDDNLLDEYTGYMGMSFNSPNDVAVRSDGTLYVTDPPFGINPADSDLGFSGLFRISPDDTVVLETMNPLGDRPNGVVLSPDESLLYVNDTFSGEVVVYDVAGDGALSNERTFATGAAGADGMAVDTAGNLFVSASAGILAYAPDGTLWGTIPTSEFDGLAPANCAFGGADATTLYVTARTGLYRVQLTIPGLP